MTNDTFEDQVRSLLHHAADAEGPAYVDVDPGDVVTTGRRVVRRRRMAAGAGIAASALVLGLGTWAALDQSSNRAVEPVPATGSADAIAPDVVSATVAAVDGGPVRSYKVHLERATGRVTATVTLASGDQVDAGMIGRIPVGERKAVWATVSRDPFIVVGVVPTSDQLMTRIENGDVGGVTTQDAPLTTTPYEAFLVQTEKSPPGAVLAGLDWSTRGAVFTADGAELPSATFADGRTVYVDAAGGELGLVGAESGARAPLPDATDGAPTGHLTTAVKADAKPTVTTFAIVLPIDANDIAVQAAPGTTLVSKDERPLLGGTGVAVIATVEGPDDVTPAVTGVTWTANGRQVTWQNPD